MVNQFVLSNNTTQLTVVDWGASLHDCQLQGRSVMLQPRTLSAYQRNPEYFGATIGPVANRIANSQFFIGEQGYCLDPNEAPHHLHGGRDSVAFKRFELVEKTAHTLRLELITHSLDYPGQLHIQVEYHLRRSGFSLIYRYTTSHPCPVNLTNHAYLNLRKGVERVCEQQLQLQQATLWLNDEQHIPTHAQWLGDTIQPIPETLYNHYVETDFPLIYTTTDQRCRLIVETSYPGFMLYNCFYPGQTELTDGKPLTSLSAFCIEPQYRPNEIQHEQATLCYPGTRYEQQTDYRFEY